jgi:hypothetical protein
MTAPHNRDRLIDAFLEDGTDVLPDWAYDEVRHDIHRTRQRVVIGPWREPIMSNLARYGVIAAAVVLLVGAGVLLLRPAPAGVAAPASAAPTASPMPSTSSSPAAVASPTLRAGALPPGPFQIRDEEGGNPGALTVTIPAGGSGWTLDGLGVWKAVEPGVDEPVITLWPNGITGTFVDPCSDHTLKQPDPKGVEDLITALGSQPGVSAGPATDVTVSGYSGQYIDTTVTADITKCGNGQDGFWLWAAPDDRRYVQGTNEVNRIYAFDLDGARFTFAVRIPAHTTEAYRAETMAMLETIEITPLANSPAP